MTRDPSERPAERQKRAPAKRTKAGEEVVSLEDLAPRKEVRGGSRKRLFGEEQPPRDGRRGGR